MSAWHPEFEDTLPFPTLPGKDSAERSPAPRIPRARMGRGGRRECWLIKNGAALTLGTLLVALIGAWITGGSKC